MGGKSKVTFPDGTTVEFPSDTPPEQITAILSTLQGNTPVTQSNNQKQGTVVEPQFSARELWEQGSKRERLAIFVRNHFMPNEWFTTIDVRDQQLQFVKKFVFGESPAIATYLNRLTKDDYLQKGKLGSNVMYKLTDKIREDYPELQFKEIEQLLQLPEND